MNQSTLHTAIIMDGNGRWATSHLLPRQAGHKAGAETLRRIVEAAPTMGVTTLTVYAFSADNWKRPKLEVHALMALLTRYMVSEIAAFLRDGVRLSVIGRRDRLDPRLVHLIEDAEAATAGGPCLHLRLAIDYSAREAILRAVQSTHGDANEFEPVLTDSPKVDLLIRTGGEQRLSDFLLWESAYAELFFTPVMWPDFSVADFRRILHEFHRRDRRFGGLSAVWKQENAQSRWLR